MQEKILRKGYTRKSYVRKDGVKVKQTKVKAGYIIDRGMPGKGKKIIPKLNKGTLSKFKYSVKDSVALRHKALEKAVKKESYPTIVRKLTAVSTLLKNTSPVKSVKFKQDAAWLKMHH